jgi:glycosyltransferase involved in cell wall biosynthesis
VKADRYVLVFNHFAVPRNQPGGTRHVELFSHLQGWTYTIIASWLNLSTRKRQPRSPGFIFVPVTPYAGNGMTRILNWASYAVFASCTGIRVRRPDAVYASSPHLLAALAGWLIAKIRRCRFILEVRDLWPQVLIDMGYLTERSFACRVLRRLEAFLYGQAERIVVLSPGVATALERRGITGDKIAYIPNAADPEDFQPSAERAVLRGRYGFTRLTGVYAGAHGTANGLSLLLDAAEQHRDSLLDIVLIGDGVEKAALRERATRDGLTNVRFLDPVPKTEIPDVLAAADFGLHILADVELFRTSVSPNKVFDYLAAGLFVVSNSPGAVAEILSDAGTGLVVKPSEVAVGLGAMIEAKPAEISFAGRRGQDWIRRQHSRAATAAELGRVLSGLPTSPSGLSAI